MVKRKESQGLTEFEGVVKKVTKEEGLEGRGQYHFEIDATDRDIGGATGLVHEWIPLSPKTKEDVVPQNSVVERFLQQVEICIDDAKDAETLKEAFEMMKGKKFKFKRMKLGQAYDGNPAKEYIAPVSLLE